MERITSLGEKLKVKFRLLLRRFQHYLPYRLARHILLPPELGDRASVNYDARAFFSNYYRLLAPIEFSDVVTIGYGFDRAHARFHYNAVENSIISYLGTPRGKGWLASPLHVLDIGSGAGHWVRFYSEVFGAASVCGVEISGPCVEALRTRFSETPNVRFVEGDISDPAVDFGQRFDLINAVGVIFHIVDDRAWRTAILNLSRHLSPGGVMVVGGEFGWLTADVQFHDSDHFQEVPADTPLLVNKRIRSLRRWKEVAREAGLEVLALEKTVQRPHIYVPENNVLFLGKRKGP